jgi:diguanylate cyclase (GGDEF)-like protein
MRKTNLQFQSGRLNHSSRLPLNWPLHVGIQRKTALNHSARRSLLTARGWKSQTDDSLDSTLSTALVAQDKELAHILREVDQLSKALKSDTMNNRSLSNTLKRTIECAVRRSHLDQELRSLALMDDLTSLYNRRAFFALAGQQLKIARRNAQGLSLFFGDIDNLKKINDFYGHREGDLAIGRAAGALQQTFRNSDIIARLGGDEFAILALEASYENREAILRRLEKNLRKSSAGESRYELSLSVGTARLDPKHPVSLEKLIAAADEAMYEQKRNRPGLCMT